MYLRVWSLAPGATSQQAQIKTVADFYPLYLHQSSIRPHTASLIISYCTQALSSNHTSHRQKHSVHFLPLPPIDSHARSSIVRRPCLQIQKTILSCSSKTPFIYISTCNYFQHCSKYGRSRIHVVRFWEWP